MEMNRENQLAIIQRGIKSLGITQHRLEILAKIPVGTIKDCKRGKRSMTADKWQKISKILGISDERNSSEQKEKGENGLVEVLETLIAALLTSDALNPKILDTLLTYRLRSLRSHNQSDAAMVVHQFLSFVRSAPYEPTILKSQKSLQHPEDQSAPAKSMENQTYPPS